VKVRQSPATPVALAGLLCLVLAGCGSGGEQEQAVLTVTFDGTSCSYDGPSEIVGGVTTIEAVNSSDVYTEVGIARIDEGSTFDDFVAFYQPEPEIVDSPDFATPIGSVPAEPGQTGSDTFTLEGGQHALVCLILIADEPPPGVFVAQPGGLTVSE
jgi:hypothetical protein